MIPNPKVSRRSLFYGTGAVAGAALLLPGLSTMATANPAWSAEPILEGPAARTAAVRGSAYLDGRVYMASRHPVGPGVVRLGVFDPFTGEELAVHDLDLGARSGNNAMAADDRYIYIGPAGSTHVWRFDPETSEVERFVEVGPANTWTYSMRVHGDHLYIGTYPDAALYRVDRASGERESFGRVGASQYTTGIAVDDEHVFAATAAPGEMKVYDHDGALLADLTEHLTESPVGVLDLAVSNGIVYASSGRFIVSMRPDGSERVVRPIAEEDRYVDKLAVTPDGRVLAIARLTSNYYEITATGMDLLGKPWQNVENQGFFPIDDETLVGVTGPGHVWSSPIGGEALVTATPLTGFGYPEALQSLLAHSDHSVWAAGHFAITVHYPAERGEDPGPARRDPVLFEVNGEPKSMVETTDGTVVAGMYPSTDVVAIDPVTHELRTLGTIDNEQMRPLAMAYDAARGDVLVPTTGKHLIHTGAVTFANPSTGAFEVRRDFLPNENIRNIVVDGDFAYIAGDTYAEAKSEPGPLEVASITEIDLRTRTVSRTFQPVDWASYEDITVRDGILFALARRPQGAWIAFDLETETVLAQGDIETSGGLGSHLGSTFLLAGNIGTIFEVSEADGGTQTALYEDVPNGYYNRSELSFVDGAAGAWGMYGTDLAWFPLPVAEQPEPDPTPSPDPTESPTPDPTESPDPTVTPTPDPTETPTPDPTPTAAPTADPTVPPAPGLPSTGR